MEKYLIPVILVLITIILYLLIANKKVKEQTIKEIFDLFLKGAYELRLEWFKTENKYLDKKPTVFVGDSLTQEFLLTEVYHNKNVCNRGIGGDTSIGVLSRLNESIFELSPKQVFLLIGTNDLELLSLTPNQIAKNIEMIYFQTSNLFPDIIFNFVSLPPVGDKNDPTLDANTIGKRTNKDINVLNKLIKAIALKNNCSYIDIHSLLKNEQGVFNRKYTREGLHLSVKGYEKIEKEYRKYL